MDQDKNVVAQGYTDKEGLVSFENIPYGNYFYREFKVGASCYKLDDNFYEFSIQEDGEVVKKNMVNERLPEAEIPATGDPTNYRSLRYYYVAFFSRYNRLNSNEP